MDFDFSAEQEIFREKAREFLEMECPKTLVREIAEDKRDFPLDLWQKMAELGWIGCVFPKKYGGAGCSFLDLIILLEEMGRACLPGPFLSTVVLGGLPILELGNEEQKQIFLPKIARGKMILTLALLEPHRGYNASSSIMVTASVENNDYVINGTKLFVPNAHVANYILCVAKTKEGTKPEEITFFLIDGKASGIKCTLLKSIAGDKQCEVIFNNVRVAKKNILGGLNHGWAHAERVLQLAAVAQCAEMLGGAQSVLDISVNHAKERVQFERPIGSFQSIQHYCAMMATDISGMRFMTYKAAWKISKGLLCTMDVAMAKAWCSDAFQRVTNLGQQIGGGMAYCEDHDMPLYFKRSRREAVAFGNSDFHRKEIARELGL